MFKLPAVKMSINEQEVLFDVQDGDLNRPFEVIAEIYLRSVWACLVNSLKAKAEDNSPKGVLHRMKRKGTMIIHTDGEGFRIGGLPDGKTVKVSLSELMDELSRPD